MDIKWIGSYFSERFLNDSIWYDGSHRPMRSAQDITNFVEARRGERYTTRRRVASWLKHILTNERENQCVEKAILVNEAMVKYHVRQVNFKGYNAIIEHLQATLPVNKRSYIPARFKGKGITTSRPYKCRD